MDADIYQIIDPKTGRMIAPVTHAEVVLYGNSTVAECLDKVPGNIENAKKSANNYTDEKVGALASSLGLVSVVSLAEYVNLKREAKTQAQFYAIYKDGELDKMYFDRSLFAKRANGEQKVTSCVFPVVFPIIFA